MHDLYEIQKITLQGRKARDFRILWKIVHLGAVLIFFSLSFLNFLAKINEYDNTIYYVFSSSLSETLLSPAWIIPLVKNQLCVRFIMFRAHLLTWSSNHLWRIVDIDIQTPGLLSYFKSLYFFLCLKIAHNFFDRVQSLKMQMQNIL